MLTCTDCHGTGKRTIWVAGKPFVLAHMPCPTCGGSGIVSRCDAVQQCREVRLRG